MGREKELFIIDGYNFIFHLYRSDKDTKKISPETLATLRDRLIDTLAQYKIYNKCELIIVFDAKYGLNVRHGKEVRNSVSIIYSKSGETADSIVEKLVHSIADYDRVFVVTSDYMQQKVVFKKNIYRKSIREFKTELESFKKTLEKKLVENKKNNEKSFYTIAERLDKNTRQKLEDLRL